MEIWRKENGSTILLAILVLAVGSALVISMVQTKLNRVTSSVAQERSTRALDLAESGLETICQQARAWIITGENLGEFSPPPASMTGKIGGGEFSVKIIPLTSEQLQITSQGSFGDITRVVREVVQIKPKSSTLDDPWVAAADNELDIKYLVDGYYYYAEKKMTLNHNAGEPFGEVFVGTGPGGIVEAQNVRDQGWTLTELKNPPKPQEIKVEYFDKNYDTYNEIYELKKEIEAKGFIYYGKDENNNWDSIPDKCKNKMVFVHGDLMINKDIVLKDDFQNLTIIATGNIHFNGDARAVMNSENASLNLIAGGNLHINGGIDAKFSTAQAFLYAANTIQLNSALGNFNCRLRAKERVTIDHSFNVYAGPMSINIPGVIISEQDNDNAANRAIFTVKSWQEIDPKLF